MNIEITNYMDEMDLCRIKRWLKEKEQIVDEGSMCNWQVIERSFYDFEMYCAKYQGSPVAFLTYHFSGKQAEIIIVEVHPLYRGSGVGRQLVTQFLDDMRETGCLMMTLVAEPPTSVPFWGKFGFKPCPKGVYWNPLNKMFKVIAGVVESCADSKETGEEIQVFDTDWYDQRADTTKEIYQVQRDSSGKMLKPILTTPYSPHRRVRWVVNGEQQYDGSMESFPRRICSGDMFAVSDL